MLLPSLLFSCHQPNDSIEQVEVIEPVQLEGEPLTGLLLARRISLDIRGQYLNPDEILMLQQNTITLDELIDEWLMQSGHYQQLLSIFASMLLTKVDEFNVDHRDYFLDDELAVDFVTSIGEETPRLMAEIAFGEQPWSEVVNSDFTMANQLLLDIWDLEPLEHAPTPDEPWVRARYLDGRPPLGLIATNGIWWRHYTTQNNKSRARSALLTKLLVCDDHFARAVTSSPLLDANAENLEELVKTDPACHACHVTLDPISASLYGFWQHDIHDVLELEQYHPEREFEGEQDLDLQMSWYGKPLSAPADLGKAIAQDERFYTCSVSLLAERLWRRNLVDDDLGRLQELTLQFQEGQWRYKNLFKALILSPEYQIGYETGGDPRFQSAAKMMTVDQIASATKALTGFEWVQGNINLLDNDEFGFRVLMGGIDGRMVNKWASEPSSSRQLTMKRFFQMASESAIQQLWNHPHSLDIFNSANIGQITSTSPDFEQVLQLLQLRLVGTELTSEQLVIYKGMFAEIEQAYGRKQAWISILSISLRNSNAWIY